MFILVRLLGGGPSTFTIAGAALRNGNLDKIFEKGPDCAITFTSLILFAFFPLLEVATTKVECFFEVFFLSISKEAPAVLTTGAPLTDNKNAMQIAQRSKHFRGILVLPL